MITINYLDRTINSNLFSSVQLLKFNGPTIYCFNLTKWFGKLQGPVLPNRGEIIALSSIIVRYRSELINIYSNQEVNSDHTLETWRSRYKNLKYLEQCSTMNDLLHNEISAIEENLTTIKSKIMIKNFPSVLFSENDKNVSIILGDDEIDFEKHVLAIVSNSNDGLKVISFRKASSKTHFKEIIKQSNDHNLLIYYSSCSENDDEITAEGPWILLPASVRNFAASNKDYTPKVEENTKEKTEEHVVQSASSDDLNELIIDEDGYTCPYCENNKRFKKKFGLTNHVNHLHPDKVDEYRKAYKD